MRYSKILHELTELFSGTQEKISILEVGSGGDGIVKFLKYSGYYKKCDIELADNNPAVFNNIGSEKFSIIEGEQLPFEDKVFDAVISVDTLEHIPQDRRIKFFQEMKRVCKGMVLLHFVMHDPERQFLGREADQRFQSWYIQKVGKENEWTAQHLRLTPPNCMEVETVFPDCSIIGTQNVETWFSYMTLGIVPIIGFFNGFLYFLKHKKRDAHPPFHGCFVKWISGEPVK